MAGDVGTMKFCTDGVDRVIRRFGHLDILLNNAALQIPQDNIAGISPDQLERTFRTNIFSFSNLDTVHAVHLPPEKVESFGSNVPWKRAGQPEEVAPSYVSLASDDASYMTGQMLHPNGTIIKWITNGPKKQSQHDLPTRNVLARYNYHPQAFLRRDHGIIHQQRRRRHAERGS